MSGEADERRQRTRSGAAGGSGIVSSSWISGDDMRRTRAAAKRAAIDDAARVACAAPVQHAKKRAALADLSNRCAVPASRNSVSISKSQAAAQVGIGKNKSSVPAQARNAELETNAAQKKGILIADAKVSKISTGSHSLDSENDENEPFSRGKSGADSESKTESLAIVPVDVVHPRKSAGQSNAADIASLEKKTLENLYISKDLSPQPDGALADSNSSEGAGWSSPLNYSDIDSDLSDPQMCSMYAIDIYQHLRMQEIKRRPSTDFMELLQQDINASMRGILIDWLVEVAEEYKLVPDTLYLTVAYIDRFLSNNVVSRQRLQLLGVSCMLIAAKYEEICAPQVEEFCYITDNTYCREEVLEMERRVLNNLHFELTTPTTKSFLRRFIRAAQAGYKVPALQLEFLGNYLAELTLVEYNFLHYLPSLVAASAVFVAKLTLDSENMPWNTTLQHYSGYRPPDLEDCVKFIHELQCNSKKCTLPAIREKYSQHKFKCVATLTPLSKIPVKYFEELESS